MHVSVLGLSPLFYFAICKKRQLSRDVRAVQYPHQQQMDSKEL